MIKWKLKAAAEWRLVGRPVEEAYVFLDTDNPDSDAQIQYEGPDQLVLEIKSQLIGSYGMRGRVIEEWTTARDLNNSMHQWIMAPFEPELVEGLEILQQ